MGLGEASRKIISPGCARTQRSGNTSVRVKKNGKTVPTSRRTGSEAKSLCFNCRKPGHLSINCKEEKRERKAPKGKTPKNKGGRQGKAKKILDAAAAAMLDKLRGEEDAKVDIAIAKEEDKSDVVIDIKDSPPEASSSGPHIDPPDGDSAIKPDIPPTPFQPQRHFHKPRGDFSWGEEVRWRPFIACLAAAMILPFLFIMSGFLFTLPTLLLGVLSGFFSGEWRSVQFVRPIEDHEEDLRPDVHANQKIKHSSEYALWKVTHETRLSKTVRPLIRHYGEKIGVQLRDFVYFLFDTAEVLLVHDIDPTEDKESMSWRRGAALLDWRMWFDDLLENSPDLSELFLCLALYPFMGASCLGLLLYSELFERYHRWLCPTELIVSESAFKQLYVSRNVDFQCDPRLVYERIKNHSKGLSTVNFSRDLSLIGVNCLQNTVDLCYHAYRHDRDCREVFQFPA